MSLTSKELKRRARTVLDGKYFLGASLSAILMLAAFAMSFLLQHTGFGESSEPPYQIFFWFLWGIMLILGALLEIGLIRFLYSLSRRQPPTQPGLMLYAFQNQPDTFILTSGFRYLITLSWFIPALWSYRQLPLHTMELTDLPLALLPILGLALVGVLPAIGMALPFCLTNYILLDEPNLSAAEALLSSRKLMHGHKKRILLLWISFLPLCLLGVGSYGIGFLWIRPYYHTTMNQFYLELTGQVPDTETVTP